MLKDPAMEWEQGIFPYDGLADCGIGPDSTAKEIRECHFDLVEKGLWTRERREAWDQLRIPERRLWVDFLMYPLTTAEICERLCELFECSAPPVAPRTVLTPDFEELGRMASEFGLLRAKPLPPQHFSEFEVRGILDGVEFDR